ncbi:hypothetical protein [Bacillus sp. UNC438CL73TsuS30]|uniref:hypothetical protein n=1 Tax=Bacillus sp. UNC438CL73TsuS30 TaxID=1340434 RepID=UPI000AFE7072|nr:hypothetical protein [Bacillus sp. UNC438CL73TsuS30]
MVKSLPSSVKWLFFTFYSSMLSFCFTGFSEVTITAFLTGFIFSIAYLIKENLQRKTI